MKIIISLVFFTCFLSFAHAQDSRIRVANKFVDFYNQKQTDSIYGLFSDTLQKSIDLKTTQELINHLRSKFGDAVSVKEGKTFSKGREFILSFQKPLDAVALIIGQKIEGVAFRPDVSMSADSLSIKSIDNIYIKNEYGTVLGTLTVPKIDYRCPVVLLISGSGPTDRNMNSPMGLKTNSFLLLAEKLAENGIASVRYDKRGIGKSTSSEKAVKLTFDDYVKDAEAFISLLKKDKRFSKVIVIGHSEGAGIGLIASINNIPTSFVSISGVSDNIGETLRNQLSTRLPTSDFSQANEILDSLKHGKIYSKALSVILAKSGLFSENVQPFLISSMKYNFTDEMSKLKIPILIINGTEDLQVGIENAEKLGTGNSKAQIRLIPGMNHVLKNVSKSPELKSTTYSNPHIPIDPFLVNSIVNFIMSK